MRRALLLTGLLAVAWAAWASAAAGAPADERPVRLTAKERAAINRVLDRFVDAAVRRRTPERAWSLATPTMRSGSTKREWARGELPVYPYPARGKRFHGWVLSWSWPNDVGIDLTLFPPRKQRRTLQPILFNVELRRLRGRWRVDNFMPAATFAAEGQQPRMWASADLSPRGGGQSQLLKPRLGSGWWALLIGALLLVPVALVAGWIGKGVRDRRRSGESWRERRELPPLPATMRDRLDKVASAD